MRPLPALLGSLLTVGTLTGANLEEDGGYGAPVHTDTAVLYDVADPAGLYESIKRDPELQLAYGEQVLRTLASTVRAETRSQTNNSRFSRVLPLDAPGTFTVNVYADEKGNLVVNGHSKMKKDSPYVYADNIIWTAPACGKEGRSHLTHGFRKQDHKEEVSQSIWTGTKPEDTKSSVEFPGMESLGVAGEKHQERLAQYKEVAKQITCEIQEALK